MSNVYKEKPEKIVKVGKHSVNMYKDGTVTIGNNTGKQNGGNNGGKGK